VEFAPPGVNPDTGEIIGYHHRLSQIKEGVLYTLFGPKKYPKTHRQANYGKRQLTPYLSWGIITGLLAFMGIVVLLNLIINGGDFAPGYEPPQIFNR